jgi:hypothetical protein
LNWRRESGTSSHRRFSASPCTSIIQLNNKLFYAGSGACGSESGSGLTTFQDQKVKRITGGNCLTFCVPLFFIEFYYGFPGSRRKLQSSGESTYVFCYSKQEVTGVLLGYRTSPVLFFMPKLLSLNYNATRFEIKIINRIIGSKF